MTQPDTCPLCRDCKHMRPDDADGAWCYSPQLAAFQGRGTRTIFERDGFDEKRDHADIRKCGPQGMNYEARS